MVLMQARLHDIDGGITLIIHVSTVKNRELAKTTTHKDKLHMGGRVVTKHRFPTPACPIVVHTYASGGPVKELQELETVPEDHKLATLAKAVKLYTNAAALAYYNVSHTVLCGHCICRHC
jgi:hypothetical protein